MTVIQGSHFSDLEGFYKEINHLLMADEDWEIGSLDGFDDILYGYTGEIIWKDSEKSKQDLSLEATKNFYESKIDKKPYNQKLIHQKLNDLINGNGATLFDILIEIIQSHPKIKLILA